MKGFRTLVLQDLPHVLPSKGFQSRLVSNYQSSSSQLHTTPSSRRFWSFFEFSAKEEPCRDEKKCPSSKDIVSSTLLSPNELDGASKSQPPNSTITSTIASNPKTHGYQFDLKSTPMSCLKIYKPLKQDNLMSLLDGNPVPKTLKWKLKGYKTLRNEQAGDFAFVPGGKSYDFDMLTRNEYNELINTNNCTNRTIPGQKDVSSKTQNGGGVGKKDTLCLTTKAIENKEEIGCINKLKTQNVNIVDKKLGKTSTWNNLTDKNILNADKSQVVPNQNVSTTPKLLTSPLSKKDIKFLPLSKSELSTSQMKHQSSSQYSSRPSKKIPKPSVPMLKQRAEKRSVDSFKKQASSMELSEENCRHQEKQASPVPKPSTPTYTEIAENITSEWSSMENQNTVPITEPRFARDKINIDQLPPRSPQTQLTEKKYPRNAPSTEPARSTNRTTIKKLKPELQSPTYFAPRALKRSNRSVWNKESSKLEDKSDYESIIGIARPNASLKISSPNQAEQATSPCAATQARLQQSTGSRVPQNNSSSFGHNGSSATGNSGGGSRKPPATYPPFTTRRSSSNSSCLTKKSVVSKRPDGEPRRIPNSKNSVSNISTSTTNPARKCRNNDESRCSEGRNSRRKCEQERPRSKKKDSRKICKRYCCPALQTPVDCDYSKFQCPKDTCNTRVNALESKQDPTCLPNDNQGKEQQGREFCTKPSRRRNDCERSSKRERQCNTERRDRSCGREQQTCQRRRSCQREEQRDCSQRDQGREICTKPRKRETCKRQRKCDDRDSSKRSAKCTGRRNYTQSAFTNRSKSVRNIKRFSSVPAFAFPLIGIKLNGETKQNLFTCPSMGRFYGKESKSPSCKDSKSDASSKCKSPASKCKSSCDSTKKEDPCKKVKGSCDTKKEDPCKKARSSCETKKKEDPCKKARSSCETKKKEDPCKKARSSCDTKKKEDPCKKARSSCNTKKKEDPCKKASKSSCSSTKKKEDSCGKSKSKLEDLCSKKREQICQDRKKVTSSQGSEAESMKERAERERKEMEECKKNIKDKKKGEKKAVSGLERVISPCKQKQRKDKDSGSCSKFAISDLPLNCFMNTISNTSTRQDNNKFLNVTSDRSYSTIRTSNSEEFGLEKSSSDPGVNFWSFNDDNFDFEEPIPVVIENQDEVPEDKSSSSSNWFFSWFNTSQY